MRRNCDTANKSCVLLSLAETMDNTELAVVLWSGDPCNQRGNRGHLDEVHICGG